MYEEKTHNEEEVMEKKCPLLLMGLFANSEEGIVFTPDAAFCKKNGCAWWAGDSCAVLRVAELIEEIMKRKIAERYARRKS